MKIQTQNVMLDQVLPKAEQKKLLVTSGEEFVEALEIVLGKASETVASEETVLHEIPEESIETDTTTDQDVSWAFWIKQFQQTIKKVAGESVQESEPVVPDIEGSLPAKQQPLETLTISSQVVKESSIPFEVDTLPIMEEVELFQNVEEEIPIQVAPRKLLEEVPIEALTIQTKEISRTDGETLKLPKEVLVTKLEATELKVDSTQSVPIQKVDKTELVEPQKQSEVVETKDIAEAEQHQFSTKSPSSPATTEKLQPNTPIKIADTEWVGKVEQIIVQEVEPTTNTEKVSTVHIQLTPENLGEMDIELTLQNKELTAKLVVEYEETKEWLEQKVTELTTKLAIQDIQVIDFEIIVAPKEPSLLGSSFEDNPFFKQQKESTKHTKTFNSKRLEESERETNKQNQKYTSAGRLSMWV